MKGNMKGKKKKKEVWIPLKTCTLDEFLDESGIGKELARSAKEIEKKYNLKKGEKILIL